MQTAILLVAVLAAAAPGSPGPVIASMDESKFTGPQDKGTAVFGHVSSEKRKDLFVENGVHLGPEGQSLTADTVLESIGLTGVDPVHHSFLAAGNDTVIVDEQGKTTWKYPHSSRDGWVLDNGRVLLALSKSAKYPRGAVVEVDRNGKTVFEFKGTQVEVNTVQPLGDEKVLLTEAGDNPRILEVDRTARIVAEVSLQAQTKDHHLQTRMTRKLANGNYLVPQLLDRVVREYDPKGKIVWEVKTPHMPFTAIRLPNGNTLIGCTLGNLVIEVDKDAKEVWRLTNDDLPNKPINDACGVQRLANGNTVITSHHATVGQVKLIEVSREKKVIWTYTDERKSGIHHFQILDAGGKPGKNPLR